MTRRTVYETLQRATACKSCGNDTTSSEPIYSCTSGHTTCAKCHLTADSCRVCRGPFLPDQQVLWRAIVQAIEDEEDWVEKVSEVLECPVCYELLTTPSWTCLRGHATCHRCRPRIHSCPVCREPELWSQNVDVYAVLATLTQPVVCRNAPYGCRFRASCCTVGRHEREHCYRRAILCEVDTCSWAGPDSALVSHVRATHPDIFVRGNRSTVSLPVGTWLVELDDGAYWVLIAPPTLRLRAATGLSGPAVATAFGRELPVPKADSGRLHSLPPAAALPAFGGTPLKLALAPAPSTTLRVAARTFFVTAFFANALYAFISLANQTQ